MPLRCTRAAPLATPSQEPNASTVPVSRTRGRPAHGCARRAVCRSRDRGRHRSGRLAADLPGTTTKVNGWQSVGIVKRPAQFNDTWGVSGVLIAPRIVLASGHGAPEKDGTFTLPTGGTATFVDWAKQPTQVRTPLPGDPAPAGDISVAVLDRPLPTPPGGFPQLLTDHVSLDVVSSLPGYVLWNGRGFISEPDHTLAGWQLPDRRLPDAPTLFTYDGDSGSTHFLYSSPTARPLMSAISIRGPATSSSVASWGSRSASASGSCRMPVRTTRPSATG